MQWEGKRRRLVVLSATIALYMFGLLVVWGAGRIFDRPHGRFTANQIRQHSEDVCRQFQAPPDTAGWLTEPRVVYEGGDGAPRRLWNVDCTGPNFVNGKGRGAYIIWDADSGGLCVLSNMSASVEFPVKEIADRLSESAATRASFYWLHRFAPPARGEVWGLAGPPVKASLCWQVNWKSASRFCRMQLSAETGEPIILKLRTRSPDPGTVPPLLPPPPSTEGDPSHSPPALPVRGRYRVKMPRAAALLAPPPLPSLPPPLLPDRKADICLLRKEPLYRRT